MLEDIFLVALAAFAFIVLLALIKLVLDCFCGDITSPWWWRCWWNCWKERKREKDHLKFEIKYGVSITYVGHQIDLLRTACNDRYCDNSKRLDQIEEQLKKRKKK